MGSHSSEGFEIYKVKEKDKFVDKYEVLASFALLNGSELENRSTFIFKLFDFDGSKTIDLNEFILSASSAIRGLCRLIGQKEPTK